MWHVRSFENIDVSALNKLEYKIIHFIKNWHGRNLLKVWKIIFDFQIKTKTFVHKYLYTKNKDPISKTYIIFLSFAIPSCFVE